MRLVPALLLAATACAPADPLRPQAECFASADCGTGAVCEQFLCVPERASACEPGRTRCASADVVETCAEDGARWVADPLPCVGGCDYGRCVPRACRPLGLRCNDKTLLVCTHDGTRYELFDQCAFACRVVDGEAGCRAD